MEAGSRHYLSTILRLSGDLEGAAREALVVSDDPQTMPPDRARALARIAGARLAQGRTAEALTAAREALAILTSLGGIEEDEALIRLVHAEAHAAAGEIAAARTAIASARERLESRAAKIADPALRRAFLDRVRENASTLSLARGWSS